VEGKNKNVFNGRSGWSRRNARKSTGVCGLRSTGFGKTGHCDFRESVFSGTVVGSEASEEGDAENTV